MITIKQYYCTKILTIVSAIFISNALNAQHRKFTDPYVCGELVTAGLRVVFGEELSDWGNRIVPDCQICRTELREVIVS